MKDKNEVRAGIICIPDFQLKNHPEEVIKIFYLIRFLPLNINQARMPGYTDYVGTSVNFEMITLGNNLTQYDIVMDRKGNKIISAHVEKSALNGVQ